MKLINVLLMLAAFVAPISADPTWQALLANPFPVNYSQLASYRAFGNTAFSSYVVDPVEALTSLYGPMGFSVYFDAPPPSGSAGYNLMELNSFQMAKWAPADFQQIVTYDVPVYDGPFLQHHVSRMWNTFEGFVYLFYTPTSNPNQVWMTKMSHALLCNPPTGGCNCYAGYDSWEKTHTVIYTAPNGYDIATMSTTVFNDNKYVAISLVAHGEPGPVVLLKSYDMITFTSMGMNITDEQGNSIKTWESFSIFSAASPVTPGEEALHIYHISDSSSQSYLRYANAANAAIGRFQNIADVFPFNNNDRILVEQMGTAAAVSPNGQTIFLVRHGRDYCSTQANTVVQKTVFPVTHLMYPDEQITVKDKNGNYRPVDSPIMPALTSDRCANDGYVHPGRQVNLMWADRSTLELMQGFANPW